MIQRLRCWRRFLSQRAGGAVCWGLFFFLRIIGLQGSRRLLGSLTQKLGPLISKNRIADKNIQRAFPQLTPQERQSLLKKMWQHLGWVTAEHAHLEKLNIGDEGTITIQGQEYLKQIKEDGKPALIFSAHLSNWALIPLSLAKEHVPISQVYRAINNPIVDRLMRKLYQLHPFHLYKTFSLIPKGPQGGRLSVLSLKQGQHMILLIDQKMNEGISVPFFGTPAMTASGLARLAEKFQCPVVPVRVERTSPDTFTVTFYKPFTYQHGSGEAGHIHFMEEVHGYLEDWIRARPEQWFWVHNRWPDEKRSDKP